MFLVKLSVAFCIYDILSDLDELTVNGTIRRTCCGVLSVKISSI